MSKAARITLLVSISFATLTVWAVHRMQQLERDTMFKGVLRDDERRKEKMGQREQEYRESLRKRQIYERVQSVASSKPEE